MKTTQKGFFNIIYGALGQLLIIAFSVVTPLLVMENYGSEVNGLLHSTEQIFVYLSLLEAGIGYASLQALYRPVAEDDRHEISAIMAATRIYYNRTGVLYTLAVVAFAFLYPVLVSTSLPYFLVVGVVLFGGLGGSINYFYQGKYMLLMQAEGYSYVTQKINILVNLLVNAAKIALLLLGFNVLAVQASFFVAQVVRALLYHRYIRSKYLDIDFGVTPDFKAVSQKNAVLVHQISYMIFSSTDILLLTFLTQDLKLVSVYTIYNMAINALYTLVATVSSGFDFKLGQMFATDRAQYDRLYHVFEIFHLTLIFSVMSALYRVFLPFISTYTRSITDVVYVHRWYPLLFVLVPLLTHGRTAASSGINFAGHFEQTKKYAVLEACINLSVSIVGILAFGLPGALMGTIAASLYRTTNVIRYYYRNFSPDSIWRTVKRWLACFAVFALVVLFDAAHPLEVSGYGRIAVAAALSGVAMLAIYGGLQFAINRSERSLMIDLARPMANAVLVKLHLKGRDAREDE